MDQTLETLLNEMKQEIDQWMAFISDKNAENIVKRTSLQIGIHDYALLEYDKGRVSMTDDNLDLSMPEDRRTPGEPLTEELVREHIVPELSSYMQRKLDEMPSSIIDYQFTFNGKFRVREGDRNLWILTYADETKKKQLQERISIYIANKLEKGTYPTKPLETFFLSRHILDEGLFPDADPDWIIGVYERVLQLNKGNQHLAEHRSYLIAALRNWAEQRWLPRYFDNIGTQWQREYMKKSDVHLDHTEQGPIELLIYAAILILKYEPSYSRSRGLAMLNCAKELGSERAKRLTTEGSGTFAKEDVCLRDEMVECTANDVFAEVSIAIKQETGESYARALRFLTHLLSLGFPKSYQIKLKSSVKQWLPFKGLAKSGTHRFFANAVEYPDLYPLMEEYAKTAMEPFEWYADTEGEKTACREAMPYLASD